MKCCILTSLLALTSAPCCSNSMTASIWPPAAAKISGVVPSYTIKSINLQLFPSITEFLNSSPSKARTELTNVWMCCALNQMKIPLLLSLYTTDNSNYLESRAEPIAKEESICISRETQKSRPISLSPRFPRAHSRSIGTAVRYISLRQLITLENLYQSAVYKNFIANARSPSNQITGKNSEQKSS